MREDFSPNFLKLRNILRSAVLQVPAYRGFQAPSVSADPQEVFEVLREFPILTKDDIRFRLDDFLCPSYSRGAVEVFTGGSTGKPLRLLRHRSEYAVERKFVSEAWGALGLVDGERTLVLRARADVRSQDGISYTDNNGVVWVQVSDLSDSGLKHILEIVRAFEPAFIRGYGSLVGAVLSYSVKVNRPLTTLKAVAYSSDEMSRSERAIIRDKLGLKLIPFYGQTERVAMAVGKPYTDRLKVFEDYGFVELVRPDGSVITAVDEYGEIVGTSLYPRATTMIRYRTGDISSWAKLSSADEEGLFLTDIVGRSASILIDRNGNKRAISWDKKDAVLRVLPMDTNVQFAQLCPGQLIMRVDQPRRPDMTPLEMAFNSFGNEFDLAVEWGAKIMRGANGKRQLFSIELDSLR